MLTLSQLQAIRDLWDASEEFVSAAWENSARCETCEGHGFDSGTDSDCPTCEGQGRMPPPLQVALDAMCNAFPRDHAVRLEQTEVDADILREQARIDEMCIQDTCDECNERHAGECL